MLGKEVRTSYEDFADTLDTIPAAYLHYLAYDVISTFELESILRAKIATVSPVPEKEQGYTVQMQESLTAYILSQTGCFLNRDLVTEYNTKWSELTEKYKAELRTYGFIPKEKGNQKELKRILGDLEKEHGITLPRKIFKKGENLSTKADHLKDFMDVPFIDS